MASIEMDRWRGFFRECGEDLWTVIDAALSIAAIDHPQQLRIRRDGYAEKLFGQPQYPPVSSNCDGPRLEVGTREEGNKVRDSKERRCRVDVDDDGDDEQRPETAEAALTTTTCSYGEVEAVTDDREDEEVLMKREIFGIRNRLEECSDGVAEEEFVGPLQRLEQINISVEALKETGIGKVVNGLRKHSSKRVRAAALRLVRYWKNVADEWVKTASEDAAAEIAGTKTSAVRSEDPVRRANPTWSDGSQTRELVVNDHGLGEAAMHRSQQQDADVPWDRRSKSKLNGYRRELGPLPRPSTVQNDTHYKPEPRTSTNVPRAPVAPKMPAEPKKVLPAARLSRLGSPECGSVTEISEAAKFEAAKKRLHEGYQQAASAKKQRTVQVMDLDGALPSEGHHRINNGKVASSSRRAGQRL